MVSVIYRKFLTKGLLAPASKMKSLTKPRYLLTGENIPSEDVIKSTNRQKLSSSKTLSPLQNQCEDYNGVLPDMLRDLKEIVNKYKQPETSSWLVRTLEYNLRNMDKDLLKTTVLTYESLVKSKNVKKESIRLAHILGWCTEMLNTTILMNDDIMDHSSYRRGLPCWHTLKDVGLAAVNDSFMIENAAYALLKKNFRHLECYRDMLELFHEVSLILACGQSLDMANANKAVTSFTMENYDTKTFNQITYYFYLPVAVAMHLAGVKDQDAFRQSKTISLKIGHFLQVYNDFLDSFGSPEIQGRPGTDIQGHKGSWLAVVCMQRANEEQKQIMLDCYGKNDPAKIQRVKELYRTLDLSGAYKAFEERTYNETRDLIKHTSNGVPHEIFLQMLNKVYRHDS